MLLTRPAAPAGRRRRRCGPGWREQPTPPRATGSIATMTWPPTPTSSPSSGRRRRGETSPSSRPSRCWQRQRRRGMAHWRNHERHGSKRGCRLQASVVIARRRPGGRRKLRPLVVIRFTDTAGDKPYLVIGHLLHASSTPYPQDIYLNPIYFLGPEEEISRKNVILDKQDEGCLISYMDVIYTRILLPEPQTDSFTHSQQSMGRELHNA